MKKRFLLVLLITIVAVPSAYFWWRQQQSDPSGELTLYGNVDIREAQLAFNGSEHIDAILVQEGDRVTKGQLLASLHTELLEAQVAEAEANLLAQQQVVAKLEAGSRAEEIRQGQAELNASSASAKAAADHYRRVARLLEKKLASPDDVESARSQADAATARQEAAQEALALLQAGPRKEDIAAARAQMTARAAGLTSARQRLQDASLYAPADGVIRNRILEPGAMASPQAAVLTLAFVDPVWVRAYLPEPALGQVTPGVRATIQTDSYPGKEYEGWVGYISPTAEFTPKAVQTTELRTRLVYSVRIYACNPQSELRLGMPATVTIARGQTPPSAATGKRCGK